MKILTILLTAMTLLFAAPVYADQLVDDHSVQAKTDKSLKESISIQSGDVYVSVNGLVCDFCARALEKVFGKEEEVKAIDVDLDKKIITINFNAGQTLDDTTLTQLITDAGYNVEDIQRAR